MNKPNMQRIPDQRMISAIGYKDGTALQRGFPGGVPDLNDAFEYWNGNILDVTGTKYFTGKNGHNLLITGYDFDSTWLKGFPYKSAATVSAPAGDAAFIAADLNNFFYDSGGTPNQIPVISLFQNVDYAGRLFCKHIAQSVDSNGVETYEPRVKEIVLYSTQKTGNQLTQCNNYFDVPTKQTSNIREVGTGKTYSTIEAAITAASAGDLIQIFVGVFNRAATYFGFSKNLKFNGFGRVETKQGTTTTVFYQTNCNSEIKNLIINCESKTTNAISTEAAGSDDLYTTKFYNCYFSNINTRINAGSRGYIWTVQDCIAEKATSYVWGSYGTNSTYLRNRIKNAIFTHTLGATMKYNRYEMSILTAHDAITISGGNYTFLDNDFIFTSGGIRSNGTYATRTSASFTFNKFYLKNNTSNAAISAINLTDVFVNGQTNVISDNYLTDLETLSSSGVKTGLSIYNNAATIERNIVIINTDAAVVAIGIRFSANSNLTTNYIRNNIIISHFTGGSAFSLVAGGEEGYYECHQNSIIEKNSVINTGATTGLHNIMVSCGINHHTRYNKSEGGYYGYVIKTGLNAYAYTSGGVYSNISVDCPQGIRIRGVLGMNVFNNTVLGSTDAAIKIDENSVQAGDQFSENIIVKNNIFAAESNGYLVSLDQHAADNGCEFDYNVYYSPKAKPFIINTTEYTFAEWQALGYDEHSIFLTEEQYNSQFPTGQLWPTTPIEIGENLGASYDDGLDILTNWGSATVVPSIVTKQQSGTWQVGAYIQ